MAKWKDSVIVRGDGKLWTGKSWSEEYPDAFLFTGQYKVQAMAWAMKLGQQHRGVTLVCDYGLESESAISF